MKVQFIQAFSFLRGAFDVIQKEAVPEGKKDLSEKIIEWGKANDTPNKIIDTLNGSITGKACLNTIERYIRGMGLNIDFEVAPGYHVNRLHRELSGQLAKLRGVAIHIKYESDFKTIAELKKMPFENFRLFLPDDMGKIYTVKYNPYYGTEDFQNKHTRIYDLYDPELVREQIETAIKEKRIKNAKEWPGQIYYDSLTSEYNEFYPLPYWWSNNRGKGGGRKWMEIEQLIGDFHDHNIDKGFLQNVLMKIVGDPDQVIPEDEPLKAEGKPFKTVGQMFEKAMTEQFAGPEAKKMLVMWAKNKDEFPALEAFPTSSNHELFTTLQRLSTENICIATQVPPVLAGVKVSGTLSKDDIENAVKLMWAMVDSDQEFLEEIYNKLFPQMKAFPKDDINIMNYSPVSITLDDKIWEVMTAEEKRQWVQDNTDVELNENSDGVQEPTGNEEQPD
jgi:hypothetical protein